MGWRVGYLEKCHIPKIIEEVVSLSYSFHLCVFVLAMASVFLLLYLYYFLYLEAYGWFSINIYTHAMHINGGPKQTTRLQMGKIHTKLKEV